jgi:hypothetical protein
MSREQALKHEQKELARWLAMDISHDENEDECSNDGDRDVDADGSIWRDEDDGGPHWIPMEKDW